ncbi:gliding motility-associated C-terminal domain-containing protein [Tamlana sp. 2201CG12-4]|uniref:T9SS type B sorting domain-containing protein n=1 Tax=Tamlana sp. 2201CG12-4 TaxID=3112582 RepID=UPI002DBA6D57|nr:gliding motility-associated C-terminal domain-containing protein [Tamlana sp. 2201CG12-4]MEC3908718.1 gliding motility-associated C-terminal domain-containing protein [Tamlana sp. 2201CG12-4]
MKNFTVLHIVVFLYFAFLGTIQGQIVIGKPNLGFSQACASPSFNTYNVTFSFSPETSLVSTNQFIIELSDESGSFTDAEVVFTSAAGSVETSPATLSFAVPTTVSGQSYKVRIKSTAPAATSSGSDAFPAYYKLQDTPFSINNLIATANYCAGGSYLLTIDNPGGPDNDSPLQYPSLTFNWYRETSPTTKEFIAAGSSLTVSESGTYFVETNYGTCTSNSYSNRVEVSEIASGGSTSINSSLGNPYCIGDGPTILSTTNGGSYQWYKDGQTIEGATSQTYETNESGEYSVNIDLGTCTTSASINLDNTGFTSSINVEENNMLEDGETLPVMVTTSANNPEFVWFLNDSEISGATTNNYEVTKVGNYRAVVRQTIGCLSSTEFLFNVSSPFPDVANIPNLISPNGDGINDTWVIPQAYVNGTNTEVTILSAQGKVVLKTDNYQNNWPENQIEFTNVNPIYYYIITPPNGSEKKGSITLIK